MFSVGFLSYGLKNECSAFSALVFLHVLEYPLKLIKSCFNICRRKTTDAIVLSYWTSHVLVIEPFTEFSSSSAHQCARYRLPSWFVLNVSKMEMLTDNQRTCLFREPDVGSTGDSRLTTETWGCPPNPPWGPTAPLKGMSFKHFLLLLVVYKFSRSRPQGTWPCAPAQVCVPPP